VHVVVEGGKNVLLDRNEFWDERTTLEEYARDAIADALEDLRPVYEVVTPNPRMDGTFEDDTVGDNPPRPLAECRADIAALLAGECGPDFVAGEFYIRHTETSRLV
jgi:hypothetical protein